MSLFFRSALRTLSSRDASVAERDMAANALLAALDEGLETPQGAASAIWRHVLEAGGDSLLLHRHPLIDAKVTKDAIRVLSDPKLGEREYDVAVSMLRGENVALIDWPTTLAIIEVLVAKRKFRVLLAFLGEVHEFQGLGRQHIVDIRTKLFRGAPRSRVAAVEVSGLLSERDDAFLAEALDDFAPLVRVEAARALGAPEEQGRDCALTILKTHLEIEQHRDVLAACFDSLAGLLRAGGRQHH